MNANLKLRRTDPSSSKIWWSRWIPASLPADHINNKQGTSIKIYHFLKLIKWHVFKDLLAQHFPMPSSRWRIVWKDVQMGCSSLKTGEAVQEAGLDILTGSWEPDRIECCNCRMHTWHTSAVTQLIHYLLQTNKCFCGFYHWEMGNSIQKEMAFFPFS